MSFLKILRRMAPPVFILTGTIAPTSAQQFLKATFFPEPKITLPAETPPGPPTFEGKAYVKDSLGRYVPIERPRPSVKPSKGTSIEESQILGNDSWIYWGSETSIAVSSSDGENAVGAWNQPNCESPDDPTLPHGYTIDGNVSWTLREFPRGNRIGFPYDPWVAAGNSPGEFFSTLIRHDDPCYGIYTSHCIIARTADGGGSYSLFFEKNKRVAQDKEAVDVDRTTAGGGGPGTTHDGKVYLGYDDRCFGWSGYCGSFLQIISPTGDSLAEIQISPGLSVQPVAGVTDGTIYVKSSTWGSTTNTAYFHEITNGGTGPNLLNKSSLLWTAPGQPLGGGWWGVNGHRAPDFGYLDIDRTNTLRRGHLYLVTNRNPNPGNPAADQGNVYLSVSTNGALSWLSAQIPTAAGKTQYFPMMDVDDRGWIHVAYYQNETGSVNGGVLNASIANLYYTMSWDGGTTWTLPIQVNHPSNALDYEDPPPDRAPRYYLVGDYAQLKTASNGKVYFLWTGYKKSQGVPRVFCTTIESICHGAELPYQVAGDTAEDYFGRAVSSVGDVDGDGTPDFVVGAPDVGSSAYGPQRNSIVYVYSGAAGCLLYEKIESPDAHLGYSVDGCGDINGDGKDDFIVGAPGGSGVFYPAPSAVFVYSGADGSLLFGKGGLVDPLTLTPDGLGFSVAGAGDLNGDGKEDFIASAPSSGLAGGAPGGSVFVYSGANGSLLYQKDDPVANDYFGWSVANVGDVNGGGTLDFAVGAPYSDSGGSDAGSVFVYSGADGSLIYRRNGASGNSWLGFSLSGIGDINGDGRSDFVAGAPRTAVDGILNAGSACVYSGADGALLYEKYGSSVDTGQFGFSAAGAGDVDGDGYPDFIIGAPYAKPNGVRYAGSAFVYSGFTGTLLGRIDGSSQNDFLGYSVAGLGDLNADGKSDFIIGAPFADSGGLADIGSAVVYASTFSAAARGDMNGDGGLTPADAVLMLNCVFLASGNCELALADVNCSGDLSPSDVVIELNMVYLAAGPGC